MLSCRRNYFLIIFISPLGYRSSAGLGRVGFECTVRRYVIILVSVFYIPNKVWLMQRVYMYVYTYHYLSHT